MYKYCVASVYVNLEGATVSYYAYSNDAYGLHLEDINNENVIWYNTANEAKKAIWNDNECIISKYFDN